MTAKIRPIQFNFSEQAYDRLTALKVELDAPSKTEVIRLALGVLEWIVDELKQGNKILVEREPDKAIELSFPYLHVRSAKSRVRDRVGVAVEEPTSAVAGAGDYSRETDKA